jgi:hypothetical protein
MQEKCSAAIIAAGRCICALSGGLDSRITSDKSGSAEGRSERRFFLCRSAARSITAFAAARIGFVER